MKIKIAFFLALKTIQRGNKGTLAMTILIMTLVFINLIFVSSIFGGIVEAMNEQSINYQYSNIVIEPEDGEKYITNKDAINEINYIDGITASSPHYLDRAVFSYDIDNDGDDIKTGEWIVKSIIPEEEIKVTQIHETIIEGRYLKESDRDTIIIGKEIAGNYGGSLDHLSLGAVKVGDDIKITFSNGVQRVYEVGGIFSTKNNQVDQLAFITKEEMESVLGKQIHNLASEILIKTEDLGNENSYIPKLKEIGFEKEEIRTWGELMGFTASASTSFDMISVILGVIGTIVAGVTIFIVIFVSVVNKRKQIGILKAIGMTEKPIILSFVMQAIFYAIIGIILGSFLMLFIIDPLFQAHPLDFPVGWVSLKITKEIMIISIVSLIVSALIGGYLPAWRGARESIIKTLWD